MTRCRVELRLSRHHGTDLPCLPSVESVDWYSGDMRRLDVSSSDLPEMTDPTDGGTRQTSDTQHTVRTFNNKYLEDLLVCQSV